jgi:hypothetical protein
VGGPGGRHPPPPPAASGKPHYLSICSSEVRGLARYRNYKLNTVTYFVGSVCVSVRVVPSL